MWTVNGNPWKPNKNRWSLLSYMDPLIIIINFLVGNFSEQNLKQLIIVKFLLQFVFVMRIMS